MSIDLEDFRARVLRGENNQQIGRAYGCGDAKIMRLRLRHRLPNWIEQRAILDAEIIARIVPPHGDPGLWSKERKFEISHALRTEGVSWERIAETVKIEKTTLLRQFNRNRDWRKPIKEVAAPVRRNNYTRERQSAEEEIDRLAVEEMRRQAKVHQHISITGSCFGGGWLW